MNKVDFLPVKNIMVKQGDVLILWYAESRDLNDHRKVPIQFRGGY